MRTRTYGGEGGEDQGDCLPYPDCKEEGTRVAFLEEEGRLFIQPVTE
jgi:hypothetical protein